MAEKPFLFNEADLNYKVCGLVSESVLDETLLNMKAAHDSNYLCFNTCNIKDEKVETFRSK